MFEAEGSVSLWLGNFASAEDFENYIDFIYDDDGNCTCQFADDAGLGWFDHDFQEATFYSDGIQDTAQLLAYSWSSSFIKEAVAAINIVGVDANALFLLYDCAYSQTAANNCRLHFIGTFPYKEQA